LVYRAAWVFYLLMAIVAILWVGTSRGAILPLLISSEAWWLDLVLGVGTALLLFTLWESGRRFAPAMRELEATLGGLLADLPRADLLTLALISGVAEELLFRGAILGSLGWLPAALLFALFHSGPGKAFKCWMIFAFLAALIFSATTHYRGNIAAAIVAHVLHNAIHLQRLVPRSEELP
jgi:membrane protease YdiL (CAAX protease family)